MFVDRVKEKPEGPSPKKRRKVLGGKNKSKGNRKVSETESTTMDLSVVHPLEDKESKVLTTPVSDETLPSFCTNSDVTPPTSQQVRNDREGNNLFLKIQAN